MFHSYSHKFCSHLVNFITFLCFCLLNENIINKECCKINKCPLLMLFKGNHINLAVIQGFHFHYFVNLVTHIVLEWITYTDKSSVHIFSCTSQTLDIVNGSWFSIFIKVASYPVGGQIGKLVGPSDYTIYGLTNERAQIRPRDSTTWSATETPNWAATLLSAKKQCH